MNVVREINKINERELDLGVTGSWHDDYKDSAYIFIGGLHLDLTEGDVIAIFSQYGEVMDVNLPRDKDTGKTKGFGFLMYEDQRSTVLAVDNLNGAKVLERTLRVDHVKNYKQPKIKTEDGEWADREEQSLNARPEAVIDEGAASESSESGYSDIDPEDPMRDFLIAQRKEEKAKKKLKSKKGKHKDETPEERRARREKKKLKKLKKSEGMRGVEELLHELKGRRGPRKSGGRSRTPQRRRSESLERRREEEVELESGRYTRERREGSRSRTPPRDARPSYRSRSRSPPGRSRRPEGRMESSPHGRDSDRAPPRRGPRT